MLSGAFRERLAGAWVEIRENLGRSTLQTLGVVLGVASVLGGFSISDSQRRRSDERWVKLGGMDRLNVQPSEAIRDGQPTALQTANLGLRAEDAEEEGNQFAWRNRIVAVPATLVARRMQGDRWQRVDRVAFRIRDLDVMKTFSEGLGALLKGNHRQQEDFRIDDIGARVRKRRSQGDVYNMIFMLSGVLSLIGGGMVNVNIQMATLKDRVREVGVKMAIGASGREVFKEFMTEALLLTGLGALAGFAAGVAFSKVITSFLQIPLFMQPVSFLWAFLLAAAFGFAFALYPAWKASRLSPMEALRYE
jgi:hypothetical protein